MSEDSGETQMFLSSQCSISKTRFRQTVIIYCYLLEEISYVIVHLHFCRRWSFSPEDDSV